jgi:dTDP-glucose pyrophosphorylase/CBS domain-containing protein
VTRDKYSAYQEKRRHMDRERFEKLLITGDKTIKQAMQQIGPASAGILFVVDDQRKLVGTLADGDIRRGLLKGLQFDDKVTAVMFKNFVAVAEDTPDLVRYVKKLIKETMIRQIPIVDAQGRIVDVILLIDIVENNGDHPAPTMRSNPVVIMAGGKGTRMDPFTKVLPKPLIPVGDLPIIEVIMNNFYRCGLHRFTYTLNYKKEYIKLYLAENNRQYEIDWVEEADFLGTAGSLALLKERIDQTFFVANCDSLLNVDFSRILRWHVRQKALITIIGCHQEYKIPFGVLQLAEGRLEKIQEKPVHDMIINTGVYVMEPDVLAYIPEGKPMDMNELIERVSAQGKVSVYTVYDGWLDIGQWKEYKQNIDKIDPTAGKSQG